MEFADFNRAKENPTTDDRMAPIEAPQKADDGNLLRALAEAVPRLIVEADVEGPIGAGRHERNAERPLGTRPDFLNPKAPKLRPGGRFPGSSEPGRTVGKAPVAVTREAWTAGVPTRKADDLVQALGANTRRAFGTG